MSGTLASRHSLVVPQDDGSCDLLDMAILPCVAVPLVDETLPPKPVRLAELTHTPTLIFVFPGVDTSGESSASVAGQLPEVQGCTAQATGFRDLHQEFQQLGVRVVGLSTQPPEEQYQFRTRAGLPFSLMSDSELCLTKALKLPTYAVEGQNLLKRMMWYCEFGRIMKLFYPVFPPGQSADTALRWVRRNQQRQRARAQLVKCPVATPFRLPVNESFYISDIVFSDKAAYIEHFKEKDIHFFIHLFILYGVHAIHFH